ncbi:MAG: metallophosphoesterase family protein [Candidatus Micrarchaeaceae archaeon]
MKIAIVSDMHIGYERFSEDAFNQAKEALEKASELADAVIMPGDIFDKRSPKPEVIAQAINIFRELAKRPWKAKVVAFESRGTAIHTSIPVIGISGTHERTAFGKENPLSLLGLAGLIVDTSEATTIIEKDGEKVAIYGLGGIAEEQLRDALHELDPKPTKGAFSIFMFHQSIFEILPFSDTFIHYDELPKGFDLYVDGHIHSRVEEKVHGKDFLIPGSTVLTQLKEGEQEEKGFIIFDTEKYTHEFIKINSRPLVFRNMEFELANPKAVKEACEKEIEQIIEKAKQKPIIKLRLEGTIDKGFSNVDMPLHSILVKYSSKAIIEIDSSRLINPDTQGEIENLRDNRIGNMPVKELGMRILSAKLKEQKFDENLNYTELFNILAADTKKEKALKEAMDFLNEASISA